VARELSSRRRGAAPRLAEAVEGLLASLAMTEARFEVRLVAAAREADWSERGIDDAEFYISPNRGEDLRPLSRTASGGELSRVMLALKTLAAGAPDGKTLIFDEVDVGIGGRVADVVGAKLQALGTGFQVLCITHLPQIAARAATHFRIDKSVRAGRTLTSVDRVEGQARVEELARMLGGAAVTDASRASARELLSLGVPPRPRGGAKAKGESERSRHV
jgi:DNA repair protein RecN (Recombination protein N)